MAASGICYKCVYIMQQKVAGVRACCHIPSVLRSARSELRFAARGAKNYESARVGQRFALADDECKRSSEAATRDTQKQATTSESKVLHAQPHAYER